MQVSPEQYRALQRSLVKLPTAEELFDFQLKRLSVLTELGISLGNAESFRKNLPLGLFLLVPPQPKDLDWYKLLAYVRYEGISGHNYLHSASVEDRVEVPEGPYLMKNIEDGYGRCNIKPSQNIANILSEGSSPYTAYEGVIHGIVFPYVLSTHNMDLLGSEYGKGIHPYLRLGNAPMLFARCNTSHPNSGAPSCSRRIAL